MVGHTYNLRLWGLRVKDQIGVQPGLDNDPVRTNKRRHHSFLHPKSPIVLLRSDLSGDLHSDPRVPVH